MSYYVFQSNTSTRLYSGSCTNGSLVAPSGSYTNYYLVNGSWVKGSVGSQSMSNTQYTCYSGELPSSYAFDINYLILPATLIFLAFCSVIMRIFLRRYYA